MFYFKISNNELRWRPSLTRHHLAYYYKRKDQSEEKTSRAIMILQFGIFSNCRIAKHDRARFTVNGIDTREDNDVNSIFTT